MKYLWLLLVVMTCTLMQGQVNVQCPSLPCTITVTQAPPIQCTAPSVRDSTTNTCTCPSPNTMVNGVCTVPPPPPVQCTPPSVRDAVNNVCTCPAPNTTVNGVCTAPAPQIGQFKVGDRIQVVPTTINVRATASITGTLLGTQPQNAQGIITGGPIQTTDGIIWWNINYDTGIDGWSGDDNLTKATAQVVVVVVTPTGSTVAAKTTKQFTATVTGTTNTAVTWSSSSGIISSTGLFTAPNFTASANVQIKATSVADPTKSGATITLVTPVVVQHTVTLNWNAPAAMLKRKGRPAPPSIAKGKKVGKFKLSSLTYNVYRSTTSGTGYVKLNATPISGLTYTDSTVSSATTYFYVATSIDMTQDATHQESGFSNQVTSVIP